MKKNKIIQLVQPKWYPPKNSHHSRECYFTVVYTHYSNSLKELSLILKTQDVDTKEISYVLEKFKVGSKRYLRLLKEAYFADFNEDRIVAVHADDFYSFSGYARFNYVNGYKQMDLDTFMPDITVGMSLPEIYDETDE